MTALRPLLPCRSHPPLLKPSTRATQAEVDIAAALLSASDSNAGARLAVGVGKASLRHDRKLQQQVSIGHSSVAGPAGEGGSGVPPTGLGDALLSTSKAHQRRAARREREVQWSQLMASKPDAVFETPEDMEAMREAAATIGDLRLRSAQDYIPDEVRRVKSAGKWAGSHVCSHRASVALRCAAVRCEFFSRHQERYEYIPKAAGP